jgi:diguanylate cyclase (GGDEF)-like protein
VPCAPGIFSCPGGVFSWPGGVFSWPGGVFSRPGGDFRGLGGVAGSCCSAAAGGCSGDGVGSVAIGTGLGSAVAAGCAGGGAWACLGWTTTAGAGCTLTCVTGAIGVTATRGGAEAVCGGAVWRGALEIVGACTTLRPGPGPSAMPSGLAGEASRRGINAPPATATASNNAATTHSLRLMLFPPPADNFPRGTIGRRGDSLEIQGVRLSSFKLKLVAYFVLLSLVPLAATYWGFSTVAGAGESRQVTLRQESGLRAALALYAARGDRAQAAAEQVARSRSLQRALEHRDRRTLRRIVAGKPSLYVVSAGGLRVGSGPRLAARFPVDVVSGTRRLGEVVATIPLDRRLVERLRSGAAFASEDVLVLLDGSRIAASSPPLRGQVAVRAGRSETVRLGDTRYRAFTAPALPRAPRARLAVLTRAAVIDAAAARTRDRLLLGLLACLALVGVVAYLQGRAIVRHLGRFATAARGIALGSLHERVPVRGRDEFAELGVALNDMAAQLEARVAELEAERGRVRESLARFGEALAATHDTKELLRVVAVAAAEATSARGSRIVSADGSVVASGDVDGEGEWLILPLTASGERFGTLELVGNSFGKEERMNAASLAAHAVVALENARLHGMVERQALVDGLTGLANRRAAADALHAEAARAERLETPLSVVLADLDGFKEVNDAHGHAVGDEVLRVFADVLRETLRESDLAGRWGGEEFLLLLPGADEEGAAQLADRVRVVLAARSIPSVPGLRVTASFGVAEYAGETNTEQLVEAADSALYKAKGVGKNRVERAARAAF